MKNLIFHQCLEQTNKNIIKVGSGVPKICKFISIVYVKRIELIRTFVDFRVTTYNHMIFSSQQVEGRNKIN
jgi:hypothetical protein